MYDFKNHSGFYVKKLLERATETIESPQMKFLCGSGSCEVAWIDVKTKVRKRRDVDTQHTRLSDGLALAQVGSCSGCMKSCFSAPEVWRAPGGSPELLT